MENKKEISDVLGIAPYGEALKLIIEKSFDGVSAVLSRICLPATEELGLMYRDTVRHWRLKNIIKIVEKAQGTMELNNNELQLSAHPRIVHEVLEEGSWCEDEILQGMWAGLLSSSVGEGQASDSNILYLNVLKKLTTIQAKIINHICTTCKVKLFNSDLLVGSQIIMTLEELIQVSGSNDVYQLDAELDNLRANDLVEDMGGFIPSAVPLKADLCPSAFLLQLYAKTNAYKGSLKDFYKDQIILVDDNGFERKTILSVG